ncbi:MAG: 4a-hydroxytetrahydrobiopterin dehydratase [Anaerolineaceae bacterium]|nr:4a-hydroxytetrahydrobiopterin dehydratase [Anaerolineaceae bacterium]
MNPLRNQTCTPIDESTNPLSESEIAELQSNAPHWEVETENNVKHLKRQFAFPDFSGAAAFANAVAEQANTQKHHPRLIIEPGLVLVDWWTKDIGGLHRNDFIMAVYTDDIYARWDLISGEKDEVEEASDESFPASDPPAW